MQFGESQMHQLSIITDQLGNQVVLIPEIIFKNKQSIDWNEVEEYLKRFVGKEINIMETSDVVYLGKTLPNEYAGSKYTRKTKGARAKAKANAAQGILEMVKIATRKLFRDNHKDKHSVDAANCNANGKMFLYDLVDIKKEASIPLKTNK